MPQLPIFDTQEGSNHDFFQFSSTSCVHACGLAIKQGEGVEEVFTCRTLCPSSHSLSAAADCPAASSPARGVALETETRRTATKGKARVPSWLRDGMEFTVNGCERIVTAVDAWAEEGMEK